MRLAVSPGRWVQLQQGSERPRTRFSKTTNHLLLHILPTMELRAIKLWNYLFTILGLVVGNKLILLSGNASLLPSQPANTAPVARAQKVGVSLNSPPKEITLLASDRNHDSLTYIIVSLPLHGTLTQVVGAQWLYTRAANYQGRDSFRFKVNDGIADSNIAAVTIVNSPHGILQLTGGTPWQLNPNVDGLHLVVAWGDLAVTEDVSGWNWTSLDTQLSYGATYHKQVGLSLKILSNPPAWLLTTYGVPTYLVMDQDGNDMTMVLPWDPIVKQKAMDFISALAHHITSPGSGNLPVDGTAAYVVMGGLGIQTETHMPGPADTVPHIPDPNNPGQDISIADELALWQQTSKDFIATYATNFRTTPYLVAAGVPLLEDVPDATTAMTDVFCFGIGSSAAECAGTRYKGYGALFGVMNWALNENSTTRYFVNEWISTNSPTRSNGFQFSTSYDGRIDPTAVLDAGLALNGHFIEIYSDDADGLFAPLIHTYSLLLPW